MTATALKWIFFVVLYELCVLGIFIFFVTLLVKEPRTDEAIFALVFLIAIFFTISRNVAVAKETTRSTGSDSSTPLPTGATDVASDKVFSVSEECLPNQPSTTGVPQAQETILAPATI